MFRLTLNSTEDVYWIDKLNMRSRYKKAATKYSENYKSLDQMSEWIVYKTSSSTFVDTRISIFEFNQYSNIFHNANISTSVRLGPAMEENAISWKLQ